MVARPAATISSASESSLVTRLEPPVMSMVSFGPAGCGGFAASQYARLSPSQHTVICRWADDRRHVRGGGRAVRVRQLGERLPGRLDRRQGRLGRVLAPLRPLGEQR